MALQRLSSKLITHKDKVLHDTVLTKEELLEGFTEKERKLTPLVSDAGNDLPATPDRTGYDRIYMRDGKKKIVSQYAEIYDYSLTSQKVENKIELGLKDQSQAWMFGQDHYGVVNAQFRDQALGCCIDFEPYTGHMAVVKDNLFTNVGSNDDSLYLINFRCQNWWPIISGNTMSDVVDRKPNFLKAVDDDARHPDQRFSGNSRCIVDKNRLKWHGAKAGGIGVMTSAVATIISQNAMENGSRAIHLSYPSDATKVRDNYCELSLNGEEFMRIGDWGQDQLKYIAGIVVDGQYCNMHNKADNIYIAVERNHAVSIKVDNNYVTNVPDRANMISIQDVPGNKIYVGNNVFEGGNLIPTTPLNRVDVIDICNNYVPQLNSDFIGMPSVPKTLAADQWHQVGEGQNVFAKSNDQELKVQGYDISTEVWARGARKSLVLQSTVASAKSMVMYLEGKDLIYTSTLQLFVRAEGASAVTVEISRGGGSATKVFNLYAGWNELPFTFAVDSPKSDDMIKVEVTCQSTTELAITGVRTYRGSLAMCMNPAHLNAAETQRLCSQNVYPTPEG